MISGFNSLCVPTYHLLTTQQIQSIRTATLELLETVGTDVHPDEARHMLADAHIGLDVIREVGPGGEFISTDQNRKMYKTATKLKDHYFAS